MTPIRVAVFGPMTGAYASFGTQMWNAAQLAAKDINAKGGVLGRDLEMVLEDDECDPGKGANVAQKVADDEGIVAALGWLCSSVAIPSSDIFAPLNLGMISVGATNPTLNARGLKNVFRVVANNDYQSPAQYLYVKKVVNPKSLALFDEGTEATMLMIDGIQKLAEKDGVKVTRLSVRPQDMDFRPILGTVPKDVDAMIADVAPGLLALLVQQAKGLGFTVHFMTNDGGLDPENYVKAAAGAAEGNWVTSGVPDPNAIPTGQDFVKEYTAAYNEPPAGYAPAAYVAVQVMADAISRSGTAERAAITDALRATKDLPTILGPMAFDETGETSYPSMYVYEVVGDGFKMVDAIVVKLGE